MAESGTGYPDSMLCVLNIYQVCCNKSPQKRKRKSPWRRRRMSTSLRRHPRGGAEGKEENLQLNISLNVSNTYEG
jgi:hypothetical protein